MQQGVLFVMTLLNRHLQRAVMAVWRLYNVSQRFLTCISLTCKHVHCLDLS
jgi:hypothetical protein